MKSAYDLLSIVGFFLASVVCLSCRSHAVKDAGEAPLKIFVLVGQSNMDGHGYIDRADRNGKFLNGTLEWLVETDPETYGKLKNDNDASDIDSTHTTANAGNWKERDDVYIAYNRQPVNSVRPESNIRGKLVAGYGGSSDNSQMGPELGFGWTIGDYYTTGTTHDSDGVGDSGINVLLIKVAWGGRSLAVEYRPPSSGGTTGLYYEAMLANVYKTLSNLPAIVPGYTNKRGYTLEGFAWNQGWNDGCNANQTAEYESNLANFIRDIRIDLGTKDLPVVVGVSGMTGWHPTNPDRTAIAEAQLAVADASLYPEFKGTVDSAETRDFFRDAAPVSPGDQIAHWNNNCESYWLVGRAMGDAMVGLLRSGRNHKKLAMVPPSPEHTTTTTAITTTTAKTRSNIDAEGGRGEPVLRGMNGIQSRSAIE